MVTDSRTVTFTATPVYTFLPEAKHSSVIDHLQSRAHQLTALLVSITGSGFESFDGLSDKMKHDYLWACEMMASEIQELSAKLKP